MTPSHHTKLRQAPRALMEQLVSIDNTALILTDLSLSGIRLTGVPEHSSLKINDNVDLTWQLLPQLKAIKLKAQCIWRKGSEVGLTLKNLDPKTKYLIRALVRYHRNSAA